jgi:hypothetical protein
MLDTDDHVIYAAGLGSSRREDTTADKPTEETTLDSDLLNLHLAQHSQELCNIMIGAEG